MRRVDPWVLAAVLLAVVLRFARLDEAPLWFDEMLTANAVRMPWPEMLRGMLAENQLPLYYILLKGWTVFAGTSALALRLPGALFACATVPVIASIAGSVKGRQGARWAAWLAALSPYLLQHGQEARPYALLGLLAALATLLLARFVTGATRRLGTGYLLVNAALLATHYYSVFFVAAEFIALLLFGRDRWRAWAGSMAASSVCAALLVIPAQYAGGDIGGTYQRSLLWLPGLVWSLVSGYTLLPSSAELHALGERAAATYLPVAMIVVVALAWSFAAALHSIAKSAMVSLAAIIAVIVLGTFLSGTALNFAINPRYAIACLPALMVLLAAGAPETHTEHASMAATGVIVLVMVVSSALHLANPGHGREDIRAANLWLDANTRPDEEILVTSEEMAALARFHWPERRFRLYPQHKVVASAQNAEELADALPFHDSQRIVYLFGRVWLSDPDGALRAALEKHYRPCSGGDVRGITILCLQRQPP